MKDLNRMNKTDTASELTFEPEIIRSRISDMWAVHFGGRGQFSNADSLLRIANLWLKDVDISAEENNGLHSVTFDDGFTMRKTYAIQGANGFMGPALDLILCLWDYYMGYNLNLSIVAAAYEFDNAKYARLFFARAAMNDYSFTPLNVADEVSITDYAAPWLNVAAEVERLKAEYRELNGLEPMEPKQEAKQEQRPIVNDIREMLLEALLDYKIPPYEREFMRIYFNTGDIEITDDTKAGTRFLFTDPTGLTVHHTAYNDTIEPYLISIMYDSVKQVYLNGVADLNKIVRYAQNTNKEGVKILMHILRMRDLELVQFKSAQIQILGGNTDVR